jgi:hypothetical protein
LGLAGCSDVLQGPSESQGNTGEGRVTITIDGGARTVLPPVAAFSRFEVTIAEEGGTKELDPVEAAGGSAELVLPVGAWDVQVWAYNQAEPVAIVAQAANILTNTAGEITGNTRFVLEPTGTGPGVLAYRITKPEGSALDGDESRIRIEQNGVTVKTIGVSDSVAGETSLEPGRYIVDVVLAEGTTDKRAVQRETVVILPGLTTTMAFAPEALVDPVDTLTFSSIGEYRAYMAALPENTKETPYRISLTGIDLQDLWEGHDPLGQVLSVLGRTGDRTTFTEEELRKGWYIALDLSGCTGTAIGSLDDPSHMDPSFNPLYDPRPIGQYGEVGTISANFVNRGRVVSLVLPESLESIGDFAFYWCSSLESVALPESLKGIGHGAFWGSGLTSVEIPDSVERIGLRAFAGPSFENGPLTSVKLSASLKEIPQQAFTNQDFNSIELPPELGVIGPSAFQSTALTSINFPNTLTTIGDTAFADTKQLESITLPASLTTLETNAFRGSGLTSVDLSACVNLEVIGGSVFGETLSLTEVTLPPKLKGIKAYAFVESSLKVLDLPPSVEIIDTRVFQDAELQTLIVRNPRPTSKVYFGGNVAAVVDVDDPSWIDNVEERLKLAASYYKPERIIIPASVIYVPDESIEAYREAHLWKLHAQKFRPLSEYQG